MTAGIRIDSELGWFLLTLHLLFRGVVRTAAFCLLSIVITACTTSKALTSGSTPIPSARYAALILNANTGRVLHAVRPDAIRFPASLTKMMTMYMAFEALQSGRLRKSTPIIVSNNAARQPASKLYMKPGEIITVDKALQALSVKSANDVAYALGETLGGSEANFARMMTRKARSLGMRSTTFRNASGLPDKRQVTSARDMAKLGIALRRRFPQHYHYFKQRSFTWKGRTIRSHNRVLGMLNGTDGIKTGYTRASGFNLVTSARTSQGRIIAVILGENSGRARDRRMVEIIKEYAQ